MTYGLSFIIGYFSADYIIKKFSPEFFIEIRTKTREYRAKIHHMYLSIFGIISIIIGAITYLYELYILTTLFLGAALHDIILEIRKKLKKLDYIKQSK
ncbi:putative membrane protein [Candidatus Nanobsidianus stetteri]|uniref:Putative membrane protein n=1 Tax=Nanobsidianus stetteri TaxID=1294122 RepID=R1E4A7_NANST|nr:putative membrane protein [Candidatus Nanobsidianus stetteri]